MKIFLIVTSAILLATGCTIFEDPSSQNTPMVSTLTGEEKPDMSEWKTYENKTLNLKISYPSDYEITENPKDLPEPEDQPDAYKDTVLYLSNQNSVSNRPDSTYGQIYIMKTKSTVKEVYAKQFSSHLREMMLVPSSGDIDQYYMFKYFTGSASNSMHTYFLAKQRPEGLADNSLTSTDILVAKVQSSYNGNIIPALTTPDWIVRTLSFID